jgi:uncharacterized protein YbjT (DUF2867 family)
VTNDKADMPLIAVTGATGYVGGRLTPALLEAGYRVHCIAREPRKLDDRPWRMHRDVSVGRSDLTDVDVLARRLDGCTAAYYLVHSMEASGSVYAERDRKLGATFAEAAKRAGVKRIIYLGGLGEMGTGLSEHLSSRREVESVLGSTGIPVTTLRAAMIIGSGSASFEILRYLVERLPVMITPSWVRTESQPVAISDVLHWLIRCLETPETAGRTLEIGGADVLPYRDLMRIMAEELGLPRRIIIPLPVLTPRLSSGWISLVTPVSYRIARPLAEGLRNRVVVTDDTTQRLMPHEALGVRDAIRRALVRVRANDVETRWSVAGPVAGDPDWAGGTVFTDERSIIVDADAPSVFRAVCRIGGGHGWYAGDLLWRLRGWMDTLVGGPGLRRGRRDPDRIEFGEALDFWRVIGIKQERSLTLLAEMKLPGVATLNFGFDPVGIGRRTHLTMTARFRPRGILGILYWYSVLPMHNLVFGGMLKGIKRTAESMTTETESTSSGRGRSRPGYGRARLWLGIAAVGTMVVASAAGLLLGAPRHAASWFGSTMSAQFLTLAAFILAYALIHVPFDLFGGYLLPRRYRRVHPPLSYFAARLLRGAFAHGLILFIVATALLFAGRWAGPIGTAAGGMIASLTLLAGRGPLARVMSRLTTPGPGVDTTWEHPRVTSRCVASDDEGYTGGIIGVLRPVRILMPDRWRYVLGDDGFQIAQRRRVEAIRCGAWRRGRLVALVFTWVGLAISAFLVPDESIGTAAGVIAFGLIFTLWSFLGLLVLPTLSRAGVAAVDARLRENDVDPDQLAEVVRRLDGLQDAEPERPAIVEAIFHPIPSVSSRVEGPHTRHANGAWDAARSAVYLSAAGLGLLGRAVHCNCGRPDLWVFLPCD